MAGEPDTQGQETPWFETFDAETKGYLQARGLDKLKPVEALTKTIQAHRNAESKLGVPADRVVRWPEEGDTEGWRGLHSRLGVPEKPEGYDFSNLKFSDGASAEDAFIKFMRDAAYELNVPKGTAEALAKKFLDFGEVAEKEENAKVALDAQVAAQTLQTSLGANYERNKFIADRAASLLGVSVDALNALAKAASFPQVMDGLLKIGIKMGEASLLGIGDNGPGNGPMTREQAMSQKRDLMADKDWVARWGRGDKAAVDQIRKLDEVIVGPRRS